MQIRNSTAVAGLLTIVVGMVLAGQLSSQSGHLWWQSIMQESFESGHTPGHSLNASQGWAVTQPASDTSLYWRTAVYQDLAQQTVQRAANIHWNSSPGSDADGYTVRLSSPTLASGSGATELYFDYWLDLHTTGQNHSLKVLITFNDWSSHTVAGTISSTTSVARGTYFVDLGALGATSSATYKIGFQAEGYDTPLNLYGWWIDDIVVLGGSNGSPSSDSYETNNSISTATSVYSSWADSGLSITAGDNDYFLLQASGGGKLTATIDSGGQAAAELYRKVGSTYHICDSVPSFTGSAVLISGYPSACDWLLRVSGATSSAEFEYDLEFEHATSQNDAYEPNDTIATAYSAGSPEVWLEDLYLEHGDPDYFTFESEAGIRAYINPIDWGSQNYLLTATLYRQDPESYYWTQIASQQVGEGTGDFTLYDEGPSGGGMFNYLLHFETPSLPGNESWPWIYYRAEIYPFEGGPSASTVELIEVAGHEMRVGEEFNFTLVGVPSNPNNVVRYSAVSPPTGLSVNAITGAVTWEPGQEHEGTNFLSFTAHNWGDDNTESTSDDSDDQIMVQVDVTTLFQAIPSQRSSTVQDPIGGAAYVSEGVSAATGEFSHSVPLFSLPGRSQSISMSLFYRSNLEYDGPLGFGWTSPAFQFCWYDSTSDQVHQFDGAGRFDTFSLASGGSTGVGPYVLTGYAMEIWRDDMTTSGDDSDDTLFFKFSDGSSFSLLATNLDSQNKRLFRPFLSSDRWGNIMSYIHDAGTGQLEEIRGDLYSGSEPTRHRVLFHYDYHGRLEKVTDFADYTAHSSVIGSSYTGSREWEFSYDSSGHLASIKLPKTERYHSETQNGSESVTTYRTRVGYSYDQDGRMLGSFDARQMNQSTPLAWLLNEYDTNGRVEVQHVGRENSSDQTKAFTIYYGTGTVDLIDPLKHRSHYVLDSNKRMISVRHYTGEWSSPSQQTASKLRSTDLDYYETSYEYDSEYNVSRVVSSDDSESHFLYDTGNGSRLARGNLLRALELPSSTYSGPAMPTDQQYGLLSVMTYVSPPLAGAYNLVETVTTPEAFEVPSNWLITDSLPSPNDSQQYTVTYIYNGSSGGSGPEGTLWKIQAPEISGSHSPHSLNNGDQAITEFSYNSYGQLTGSIDPEGIETELAYGTSGFSKGRPVTVSKGAQTSSPLTTNLTYDWMGRAVATTDPMGETWKVFYNQLDLAVRSETPEVTGPDVVYWSESEYDLNGNLIHSEVANISETGSAGGDGHGSTVGSISTSYHYNIMDMVFEVHAVANVTAQTTITKYFFDNLYRMGATQLPEGNYSAVEFDELGRAIKSYWGFDGTNVTKQNALIQSESFYDAASRPIKTVRGTKEYTTVRDGYGRAIESYGPAATGGTHSHYSKVEYDRASRPVVSKSYGVLAGSPTLISESRTHYDNNGRPTIVMALAKNNQGSDLEYSSLETSTNYETGWSTSRTSYRKNGQVEYVQDDLGYKRYFEHDDYGRISKLKDDLDAGSGPCNEDEFVYDAGSNLIQVISKFVDQAASNVRTVTTDHEYDELGRRVKTIMPELEAQAGRFEQSWQYDSHSNPVVSIDRMGVVRRRTFDLHGRPRTSGVEDVTFSLVNPSNYNRIAATDGDIEYLNHYDKNSNLIKSVDPNGNTTEYRYDLAHRWLQTLMPDGPGSSVPHKRTAGGDHSVTQVGSGAFWSKSGAYDQYSNLLAITDPNGTVVSYDYDAYGRVLAEAADTSAATTNGFTIVGEDGQTYGYDHAGRLESVKTWDGTTKRTEVEMDWNTLGLLERETTHVNDPSTATSFLSTSLSSYDESGRRYKRVLEGLDLTTRWTFDRLHRPTTTRVSQVISGGSDPFATLSDNIIEQFWYIGGGFTHSKHRRWLRESPDLPFETEIEHDDWLRVIKMRHVRKDSTTQTPWSGSTSGDFLLAAYEYRYNPNNMMEYEGYWFNDDGDGTSDSPMGANLFYYDERNELVKAIYHAQVSGLSHASMSASAAATAIADLGSSNNLTHLDRVVYDLRNTGGRRNVNWYRAEDTPDNFPDSATTPDQTTSHDTGESVGAGGPVSELAPGNGERGEYQAVGLPGGTHEYDYNKNLLADSMRTMRYNYRNQLRDVHRKSDGAMLSQYRNDGLGRVVWDERHWYLGRIETLDSRFPSDIVLDADSDSVDMALTDGGMTAYVPNTSTEALDEARWTGRLRESSLQNPQNFRHCFDFFVYVPTNVEGLTDGYIGYLSYEEFTVHFFTNRTICKVDRHDYSTTWDTETAVALSHGWHNVAIIANHYTSGGYGQGMEVWVDGTKILDYAGHSVVQNPHAYFGAVRAGNAGSSMAVHDFASYWSIPDYEYGTSRPTQNFSPRDKGNRSEHRYTENDNAINFAAMQLGDDSNYVFQDPHDSDETLQKAYAMNGRRIAAIEIHASINDGSGNGILGVAAFNLADSFGDPNWFRGNPDSSYPTLISHDISDIDFESEDAGSDGKWVPGGDSEPNADVAVQFQPTSFGGGRGAGPFEFGFPDVPFAVEQSSAGSGDPMEGRPTDDGGNCACRGADYSEFVVNTGYGEPTLGNVMTDVGQFGTPGGVEFSAEEEKDKKNNPWDTTPENFDAVQLDDGSIRVTYTEGDYTYSGTIKDKARKPDSGTVPKVYLGNGLGGGMFDNVEYDSITYNGKEDCDEAGSFLSGLKLSLDILGFLPVIGSVFDLASAAVSLVQGNYGEAALSLLGAIPGIGDAAALVKGIAAAGGAVAAMKLASAGIKKAAALVAARKCGSLKSALTAGAKQIDEMADEGLEAAVKKMCFIPGTLIATADGNTPIEELQPGDTVQSWTETTGTWTSATVGEVYVSYYSGVVVTVTAGSEAITSTPEHPYFVIKGEALADRATVTEPRVGSRLPHIVGEWVAAKDLLVGDLLLARGGKSRSVAAVRTAEYSGPIYNLAVPGPHTYTVGTSALLVHNMCAEGAEKFKRFTKETRKNRKHIEEHKDKLEKYKADPDKYDNLGKLKNAKNEEERRSIIEGRIESLRKQIRKHEQEIEKKKKRILGE